MSYKVKPRLLKSKILNGFKGFLQFSLGCLDLLDERLVLLFGLVSILLGNFDILFERLTLGLHLLQPRSIRKNLRELLLSGGVLELGLGGGELGGDGREFAAQGIALRLVLVRLLAVRLGGLDVTVVALDLLVQLVHLGGQASDLVLLIGLDLLGLGKVGLGLLGPGLGDLDLFFQAVQFLHV